MTVHLLDANVAIALTLGDHEHHDRAAMWFTAVEKFALCPIVEGAVTRFHLRMGQPVDAAVTILRGLREHPRAQFWPDDLSYTQVPLGDIRGHRQVTDAYLVALAVARGGVLATLDEPLARLRPEGTLLLTRGGAAPEERRLT